VLTAEMTLTDPAFYTRPVTDTKKWAAVPERAPAALRVRRGRLAHSPRRARERKQLEGVEEMKQLWSLVSAVALVVALGSTASAHHSAVQYDFAKSATITGVGGEVQAINPHMRLTLRVTDDKGTREVELEGHSTNNMYRAGYRDGNDQVRRQDHGDRRPSARWARRRLHGAATLPDGRRFGVQSAAERAASVRRPKASRKNLVG
jgi:hypothetical protein